MSIWQTPELSYWILENDCVWLTLHNDPYTIIKYQPKYPHVPHKSGFPSGWVGKESACNAGDVGSIPGSGRFLGERNGTPRQYFRLENPMDRGARQATVHRVIRSQTRLKQLSTTMKVTVKVRSKCALGSRKKFPQSYSKELWGTSLAISAKNPPWNVGDMGSISDGEAKIPHAAEQRKILMKDPHVTTKTHCSQVNKIFKK